MKKLLTTLAFSLLGLATAVQAQTFTYTTAIDTMINNGDTLTFTIPNTPVGAYAPATVRIFTSIDNGDITEFVTLFDENWTSLYVTTPEPTNNDCVDITYTINPTSTQINTWAANGSMTFYTVPSTDVDMFCNNTIYLEVSYDTCVFGTPVQFAAISAADSSVCPANGNIQLSGTPAGGTFSGQGVTGSQFNPAGFAAGVYTVSYTATDAIGCVTTGALGITVEAAPVVTPILVCPGTSATISPQGNNFAWFADANLSIGLDTAATFTTPILLATTQYYVQRVVSGNVFEVTTITSANTAQVDHNSITGDDRAGIAVSDSFVFIVGDNNTGRYDHNLANGISLPIRDGIFSNLANNTVWSLYNGTAAPQGTSISTYTVSELVQLDNMLNFTNTTLTLSSAITMNCNNRSCGVMAGSGYLGLYSNDDDNWYVVNLTSGAVTNLGSSNGTTSIYYTENWAHWGILEFDGSAYQAIYHNGNNNTQISRQSLPDGNTSTILTSNNLGDMSSLIVMPSLNRFYAHCESCSYFGAGGNEVFGYADATTLSFTIAQPSTIGCANVVTVEVPKVDLGADVAACTGNLHTMFAGLGYSSYTWNGVNNNFNAFTVNTTGTYTLAVLDDNGCTLRDTVAVTFSLCSGVDRSEEATFNIYPNPTTGIFTIAATDFSSQGEFRLEAFDMTGRLVKVENFGVVAGQLNREVSLAGFAAGVYTIRLSDSQSNQAFKLVITE